MDEHRITTAEQLQALFAAPGEASLRKETTAIHPVYRRWIEHAPFVVLATSGPGGMDASPRGDPAGFVAVQDEHTLLLPERRGNNRIDSLRNIVADPRVGLLFMIPGIGETLRVNGRAHISVEPRLLDRLAMQGRPPQCVIVVQVEAVYFQCARALQRSQLWGATLRPNGVPTAGEILQAVTANAIDGKAYDTACRHGSATRCIEGARRMDIRICIDVDDMERAIAFYTQGLGLAVGRRLKGDWVELLGAGSPIDLLLEQPGSAPLGEQHAARRDYARHWTPVHLDFVVDDADLAAARLVSLGAKLERAIVQRRWGRMANLADPFGHGIDLLQMQGRGYDEMLQGG